MKQITPMELLTLFHKSDKSDVNLSVYDQKLLSVLITFINEDLSKGYRAWPSSDTIKKRSGIKDTKLTECRAKLLADGWLTAMEEAKGPGRSRVYHINAQKIVDMAKKAGAKVSDKTVASNQNIEQATPHKRNTSGLVQNKKPPPSMYEEEFDAPF